MIRRIKLGRRIEHNPAQRFARRHYWLTMREAATELGVSRRRTAQLVEELRIRVRRDGHGRTAATLVRGCCVEAARSRQTCDVPHGETSEEPEGACAMHNIGHRSRDPVNPSPDRCGILSQAA